MRRSGVEAGKQDHRGSAGFLAANSRARSGQLKERSCSSKCSLGSSESLGGPEDQPQSCETQPHPRTKISPLAHCARTRRLPQGDWPQDGCQCTAGCLRRHTRRRQSSLQWELCPRAAFLQTGASHTCTHKPSLSTTNKKAVKVAFYLKEKKVPSHNKRRTKGCWEARKCDNSP